MVTIPTQGPGRTTALAELESVLSNVPENGFAEIWVDHDSYPALCALVNAGQGWLMCLRYDGDAGLSSRNPSYAGSPDANVEYKLGNGQVDRYPAAWAYPRAQVFAALRMFATERLVPDDLHWFNDSGDGAISPNDPVPR